MATENLDLTYIHARIIVIGSPYINNSLNSLRSYLQKTFSQNLNGESHYCIYNFSSEEEYNIEQDLENVITYGSPENTPCPFENLISICTLIDVYLNKHPENVIVLHSKTGKGRSCLVAACILLLCAHVKSATEAIEVIRAKRGKDALSLPSQIRYLYYYERLLGLDTVQVNTFQLLMLRINTIPKFNSSIVNAGCTPFFTVHVLATDQTLHSTQAEIHSTSFNEIDPSIYQNQPQYIPKKVYESFNPVQPQSIRSSSATSSIPSLDIQTSLLQYRNNYDEFIEFDFSNFPITVRGDLYFTFYHYSSAQNKYERMFQLCLHSAFIETPLRSKLLAAINTPKASPQMEQSHNLYYQTFAKDLIDFASTDIYHDSFDEKFSVELLFQQKENQPAINQFTEEEYISIMDSTPIITPISNSLSGKSGGHAALTSGYRTGSGKFQTSRGRQSDYSEYYASQFNDTH